MSYTDPERFRVKRLSDHEVQEYKFLKRLSARYILLGMAATPLGFIMLLMGSAYAFVIWLMGFGAIMIGSYYDLQAKRLADE